jgi:excisionase family DNA binding protein
MKSRKSPGAHCRADRSEAPRSDGTKMQKFLTVDQIADAFNVSVRTVRRWIKDGKLVAHRFGAAVRIGTNDLAAFVAIHRDI